MLSIAIDDTVGRAVESCTTTARVSVIVLYEKYVDVDVIGSVLSTRISKLLLSVDKIPKSDATVTLKYCPVKAVVSVVEESVVALRKPESSYSATFIILPFSVSVLISFIGSTTYAAVPTVSLALPSSGTQEPLSAKR